MSTCGRLVVSFSYRNKNNYYQIEHLFIKTLIGLKH